MYIPPSETKKFSIFIKKGDEKHGVRINMMHDCMDCVVYRVSNYEKDTT